VAPLVRIFRRYIPPLGDGERTNNKGTVCLKIIIYGGSTSQDFLYYSLLETEKKTVEEQFI
jgi:hypothetical protein